MCSAVVLRYIGSDDIAATPRMSTESRVRSQSVMNAGGPAAMKSTEPDSSASFMHGGPAELYPADDEVGHAGGRGVFLDEAAFLHHEQRQESDAARAERNPDLVARPLPRRRNRQPPQQRGCEQRGPAAQPCESR